MPDSAGPTPRNRRYLLRILTAIRSRPGGRPQLQEIENHPAGDPGAGHHIQYEDGLFDSTLPAPEATRRTELMADSFSAYFLTHVLPSRVLAWLFEKQLPRLIVPDAPTDAAVLDATKKAASSLN
ncbi:hypothetical protein [Kribbella sp. DT2]|uniref:hypothetical protein n=1 Tax=Kribbella sp. DT2 TaxID=3393427 RepID=UPI003CF68849